MRKPNWYSKNSITKIIIILVLFVLSIIVLNQFSPKRRNELSFKGAQLETTTPVNIYNEYIRIIDINNQISKFGTASLFGYKIKDIDEENVIAIVNELKDLYPAQDKFNLTIYSSVEDYYLSLVYDSKTSTYTLPEPLLEISIRNHEYTQAYFKGKSILWHFE